MPVYVSDLFTATAAPVSANPTPTRSWTWLRSSTTISGATSSTYTAVTADIGSTLSVSQFETNLLGTATATSAVTETVQAFDPIRLFSASEPGVWYDPTDISTLYQNSTGTIPVTSFGQPVGLMLDKSRGLVLGPELVTNGDFSGGTTGWLGAASPTLTVVSGELEITRTATGWYAYQDFPTVVGKNYVLTGTVRPAATNSVAQSGRIALAGPVIAVPADSNGTTKQVKIIFVATATSTQIVLGVASSGATGATGDKAYFDNISVKELPGLHATQSTEASRPLYGIVPVSGRRNQILWSENMANAVWNSTDGATVSGSTVSFTPTGYRYQGFGLTQPVAGSTYTASAFLSSATKNTIALRLTGSTTGTDQAVLVVTLTPTPTRYTVTRTFTSSDLGIQVGLDNRAFLGADGIAGDVVATQWQLELGSTATAYQKVTTDLDVTEAGVASVGYLRFDGTNSFMVTPTITPGTDKVQVFTGVRKISEATFGVIAEISSNYDNNAGVFSALGGGGTMVFASKGTTSALASSVAAAPVTVAFTGLGDISGDTDTLRLNGVQVMQTTTDQGTGNFLAYPLYIGRRGGTSLALNGQLFPLIVRFGPNLTAARIAATEAWVATKTAGVTLP